MRPILDQLSQTNFATIDLGLLLVATCIALISILLVSLNGPRKR